MSAEHIKAHLHSMDVNKMCKVLEANYGASNGAHEHVAAAFLSAHDYNELMSHDDDAKSTQHVSARIEELVLIVGGVNSQYASLRKKDTELNATAAEKQAKARALGLAKDTAHATAAATSTDRNDTNALGRQRRHLAEEAIVRYFYLLWNMVKFVIMQ